MPDTASLEFSIIVPVYNRPEEVRELLNGLKEQSKKDFEVLIVDDGSTRKSEDVVEQYGEGLDIKYFYKENSGPGLTRNYGCERAKGNYFIFLDSDCILPIHYFETVQKTLSEGYVDAFGGPDEAHEDFTPLQKAISYSMTSFFTTGGIRGGGERLEKFHPRSFNMGFSREVYESTGGFSTLRFGEDIDMSIRILSAGFRTKLIKGAYVFHKRRTNLRQFFKQVYNSGIARINLYKRHPSSLRWIHFLPSVFTIGLFVLLLLSLTVSTYFLGLLLLHALLIMLDATIRYKDLWVGVLAIATTYCQLLAYGTGFIAAFLKRVLFKKGEFAAFTDHFYD